MRWRVNGLHEYNRGFTDRSSGKRVAQSPGIIHTLFVLLVFGIMPITAWAEDGRAYLDMTGGYKTGDFGTPTKSELFYLQPALGYVTPRYDVSITIPYLFLNNTTAGQSTTEDGIGDIYLHVGMCFYLRQTMDIPFTDPSPLSFPPRTKIRDWGLEKRITADS
jgi:hypothetical protein